VLTTPARNNAKRRRIGVFNGFVLAGGLVNAAVVLILLAYWMIHG